MPCRTCRHSRPVDRSEANIAGGSIGTQPLSIMDAVGRGREWVVCRAHGTLIDAEESCEHFAKPLGLLGRVFSRSDDAALYRRLADERRKKRAALLADADRRTAEAEARVNEARRGNCLDCGMVHNRCPDCDARIEHCGVCQCGGVSVKIAGRWYCILCTKYGPAPTEPQTWPYGVCDACHDYREKHGKPVERPGAGASP